MPKIWVICVGERLRWKISAGIPGIRPTLAQTERVWRQRPRHIQARIMSPPLWIGVNDVRSGWLSMGRTHLNRFDRVARTLAIIISVLVVLLCMAYAARR